MSSLFSLSSAVFPCIVSLSMDFVIGPLRVSNYSVSWNSLPMANLSVGVIAKRLCPAELLWYLWIYYIFSKCLLVRNFWVFYIQLVSGVRNLFPSSFRHWRIPKTDFLVILIAFFVISLLLRALYDLMQKPDENKRNEDISAIKWQLTKEGTTWIEARKPR